MNIVFSKMLFLFQESLSTIVHVCEGVLLRRSDAGLHVHACVIHHCRSNQKSSLSSKLQGENAWNQGVAEEWADEEIDPSVFTECSTDDDKLRNKSKMKAAAVAAQSHSHSHSQPQAHSQSQTVGGVVSRPLATTGIPTPTTTTTVSSTATTHSWQEVTKTTR